VMIVREIRAGYSTGDRSTNGAKRLSPFLRPCLCTSVCLSVCVSWSRWYAVTISLILGAGRRFGAMVKLKIVTALRLQIDKYCIQ